MTHANGDIYEGEWKDDKANGKGTFVDSKMLSMKDNGWMTNSMVKEKRLGVNQAVKQQHILDNFTKGKKNGKGRF